MKRVLPILGFLLFSYYLFAQDATEVDIDKTVSKVILPTSDWVNCENGMYYYDEATDITKLEKSVLTKNIGIGLFNPVYKLHAAGDICADGGWLKATGSKGLYFQSYGGGLYMTDATWIRTYGNKSFYHNTGTMRTDGTFQVGLDGDRFIVNTSGNVGIGTTNPISNLDISSSTTPIVYIQSLASGSQDAILNIRGSRTTSTTGDIGKIIFGSNDANGGDLAYITARKQTASTNEGNLLFWTTTTNGNASTEKMRVASNGNVGIGTSSPTKKLDVSGDINYTGNLYKNGTLMTFGSSGVWTDTDTSIYYNSGNVGIGCDPGSATFKIYKSSLPSFELSSSVSRIQIGMATCDGCFAGNGGRSGDAVIRTLGGTNSTILYIPNNNNDGNSYIGIGDSANAIWFKVYNNKTVRMNGKLYATEIEVKANVWSDYVFNDEYNLKSLKEVEDYIKINNRLPEVPSEEEVKEKGINLGEMDAILLTKIEELTLYIIDLKKENEELRELFNKSMSK